MEIIAGGVTAARGFEAAAAEHFTPDEKYPDLSRSQLVKHLLLALSL